MKSPKISRDSVKNESPRTKKLQGGIKRPPPSLFRVNGKNSKRNLIWSKMWKTKGHLKYAYSPFNNTAQPDTGEVVLLQIIWLKVIYKKTDFLPYLRNLWYHYLISRDYGLSVKSDKYMQQTVHIVFLVKIHQCLFLLDKYDGKKGARIQVTEVRGLGVMGDWIIMIGHIFCWFLVDCLMDWMIEG